METSTRSDLLKVDVILGGIVYVLGELTHLIGSQEDQGRYTLHHDSVLQVLVRNFKKDLPPCYKIYAD